MQQGLCVRIPCLARKPYESRKKGDPKGPAQPGCGQLVFNNWLSAIRHLQKHPENDGKERGAIRVRVKQMFMNRYEQVLRGKTETKTETLSSHQVGQLVRDTWTYAGAKPQDAETLRRLARSLGHNPWDVFVVVVQPRGVR